MVGEQPFRFLDLPGEIRTKIYKIILCSFEPSPPAQSLWEGLAQRQSGSLKRDVNGISPVVHSIEPSILCTSKQVHREAYDVMIKTNQFIHIRTTDLSMGPLLTESQIPIVTMDRAHAERFAGYVLRIELATTPQLFGPRYHEWTLSWNPDASDDVHCRLGELGPRFSFMILHRDWNAFCRVISETDIHIGYFSKRVGMVLTLRPWADSLPGYKAPITDFFTEKTQAALLKPFRTLVRGFRYVNIVGTVLRELAESTVQEVKECAWTDPHKILSDLQEADERAGQFYADELVERSIEIWTIALCDIRRIRASHSWPTLVQAGAPFFASKLDELQLGLLLSSAQYTVDIMKASPTDKHAIGLMGHALESNLEEAAHIFIERDISRHPDLSSEQILAFRVAFIQYCRLRREVESLSQAVRV